MQSMVEDLHADTAKLAILIRDHTHVINGLSYLTNHFEEFISGQFSPEVYKEQFARALNGFSDFQYTDRTIDQLKNSGGMRLIRKQEVSDSIIFYNDDVRDYLLEQESLGKIFEKVGTELYQLYNFRFLRQEMMKNHQDPEKNIIIKSSDLLLTHDKQKIEGFYNLLDVYMGTLEGKLQAVVLLKEKATRLIQIIKSKYKLH